MSYFREYQITDSGKHWFAIGFTKVTHRREEFIVCCIGGSKIEARKNALLGISQCRENIKSFLTR